MHMWVHAHAHARVHAHAYVHANAHAHVRAHVHACAQLQHSVRWLSSPQIRWVRHLDPEVAARRKDTMGLKWDDHEDKVSARHPAIYLPMPRYLPPP